VAILVSRGRKDGGMAILGQRQKMVGMARCTYCVHRDLEVAVGSVLKPDRTR